MTFLIKENLSIIYLLCFTPLLKEVKTYMHMLTHTHTHTLTQIYNLKDKLTKKSPNR